MQIVHLMVEIERRRMTRGALPLAEENLLAIEFTLGSLFRIESAGYRIELRRRRKIQHVLNLRHVADLDAVENVHSFLHGVNGVTVEISRPLLELRKIF